MKVLNFKITKSEEGTINMEPFKQNMFEGLGLISWVNLRDLPHANSKSLNQNMVKWHIKLKGNEA